MFQQQRCRPFHGFGSGKPTTGFPQAAGTPVGNPRFPGVAGTLRFLATRQVHNSPFGTMVAVTATSMSHSLDDSKLFQVNQSSEL